MSAEGSAAPDPRVPHDNASTTGILRDLAAAGFDTQFVPGPAPAVLRCTACGSVSAAGDFRIQSERRLEGASDPDDMVLVVAATCPVCTSGGAIVLGYGPSASEADSDLVLALQRPAAR